MDYVTSPGMWRGLDRDHEVVIDGRWGVNTAYITCGQCGMPAHMETERRSINVFGRTGQRVWYPVHGPAELLSGQQPVIELPAAVLAIDSGNERKRHLPGCWPKPVTYRAGMYDGKTLCHGPERLYVFRLGDIWMLKACELCKQASGFAR